MMDTVEHTALGVHVGGDADGREAALTELRNRLEDALAHKRLTKTQLATRTRLARTTVQAAFQAGGPVPSAATVTALAGELGLPAGQMLELRRTAAGETGPARHEGPGKPIGQWDPHDLEVHPAGTAATAAGAGSRAQRVLPAYVRRAHDQVLAGAVAEAAQGRSRMLILVGSSSTGKTRACWEAVQPLAARGWCLWHPYDPTRVEAALADLGRVAPRTVVWLNEAQHYLGRSDVGERIAAALHTLLTETSRGPVLVLGTLWPEYAKSYTTLPQPGQPDPHSRVRELLSGRTLTIPDAFDDEALRAASTLARDGDRLLADALTRAHAHGRVTQDLAGAPELVRRYEQATPPVRVLLQAAMDARRLGVGPHLPQAFLIDAAIDYLSDDDYDQLTEDWAEAAFADLADPAHGQAPLRRTAIRPRRRPPGGAPASAVTAVPVSGPVFRLADYLDQHGRNTRRQLCPPDSFWHAAHTYLTDPLDLSNLATAAHSRLRLQWAYHLWRKVADAGETGALVPLARLRGEVGDREGAESLYRQAIEAGHVGASTELARWREEAGDRQDAEALHRQAAATGGDDLALASLINLAWMRERTGDREGAEALAWQLAEAGYLGVLTNLAEMRLARDDREGAETLYRQIIEAGHPSVLFRLAALRWQAGDQEGAETLYWQAADTGDTGALSQLVRMREEAGDREGAETLACRAAAAGDTGALT
ncbi:hypothetical protein C3492_36630, partial [Streptomyces sp. Ru62]|uniref:sel1 repeat family protein n=1 Tax=Streptomyces sp. Ru62 TaxID=2080745 RepID=UPI000CDE11B5